MPIQSIAVFCGSKAGNDSIYKDHASQLGTLLGKKNISIIYGGGNKGLMAAVANSALKENGTVIGIIPEVLTKWEHQHESLSELIVVDDMHTRKKIMYEKGDAAIILAGGFGTLDELFEMLTWNQLNIHNKHIFILNTAGFYNHLIEHIKQMSLEGFLYDDLAKRLTIVHTPDQMLQFL